MREEPHIAVRHVSKKFARSLKRSFVYGAQDVLRAATGRRLSTDLRPTEFWALRNIDLTLQRGQSVGIVGLNGSGKTTLLRLISGILRPTLGTVKVNGVIAPMLALGAGFKPVLSGRENIFLNMSLLGLTREEIRRKLDEVIDFAELWEAIDAPLGTYSTGMQARLGFACAVHTDPQILVVDEVLSVGDTRFRLKCRNRVNALRRAGTSMLLVSHSAVSIETLTDECIYLKRGRLALTGSPAEVLRRYQADMLSDVVVKASEFRTMAPRTQSTDLGQTRIAGIRLLDRDGQEAEAFVSGALGALEVAIETPQTIPEASLNMIITDASENQGEMVQFMISRSEAGAARIEAGAASFRVWLQPVVMRAGTYRLKISLSTGAMHDMLDAVENYAFVVKAAPDASNAPYFQPRRWTLAGGSIGGDAEADAVEGKEEF